MPKEKTSFPIKIVQDKLWRNGYSVRRIRFSDDYDLLVDGVIKVKVGVVTITNVGNLDFQGLKKFGFDWFAAVQENDLGSPKIFFYKKGWLRMNWRKKIKTTQIEEGREYTEKMRAVLGVPKVFQRTDEVSDSPIKEVSDLPVSEVSDLPAPEVSDLPEVPVSN